MEMLYLIRTLRPSANTFSAATGGLNTNRYKHVTILLANGKGVGG